MEKLERDFDQNDFEELDDVLDCSFFAEDEMVDLEEDERNYEMRHEREKAHQPASAESGYWRQAVNDQDSSQKSRSKVIVKF